MSAAPGTPGPGANSPWLIANVLAQISFGLLAMTLCLPSMQEWGAIFDTRQADVQLTFSGYVVAYGALQLVYGPLSDRHGRKPILMIGLVVVGLVPHEGAVNLGWMMLSFALIATAAQWGLHRCKRL
jgi:DHA1 family bicyclomycin/chloramphenicol resistance-like MFS transporter